MDDDGFDAFTPEHFGLIGFFVVVFVALVVLGRSRGDDPRLRRWFAIAICCFTVPMQVWQLLPSDFGLGTSLPLQYCDLAWIFAAYALWTRSPLATAISYYWGLTLTIQGVLTPSLGQEFPDPRYFMFWGMHFLSIWAAGYLVATGGRPTWPLYRRVVLITAAWAGVVMVFNAVTDTNYGYFNGKPSTASALDLLPPWPTYILVEILLISAVWAAMTWPFTRRRGGRDHSPDPARRPKRTPTRPHP